jgi:hypothetical protein
MKITLKWFAIIGCIFGSMFRLNAQGYIVPNGVVTNLFPGEIDLSWPQETQVNGFTLTPSGKTVPSLTYDNIFSFNEPATIGVRVFLVSFNDPISLQPVLSMSYPELTYPNSYVFNVGTPFYVGLYSGASIAPPFPPYPPYIYTDPVFGWAELENVNGTIEVLDSALEYQGGGIFAGTQNIIPTPEPGTLALLSAGVGLLGLRWRQNKSRQRG